MHRHYAGIANYEERRAPSTVSSPAKCAKQSLREKRTANIKDIQIEYKKIKEIEEKW